MGTIPQVHEEESSSHLINIKPKQEVDFRNGVLGLEVKDGSRDDAKIS